ncbi:hypothetical protein BLOT_000361, partial [Blomia tropicalis]
VHLSTTVPIVIIILPLDFKFNTLTITNTSLGHVMMAQVSTNTANSNSIQFRCTRRKQANPRRKKGPHLIVYVCMSINAFLPPSAPGYKRLNNSSKAEQIEY